MRRFTLLAIVLTVAGSSASAQAPRLGTIEFPTSATGAAQERFLRGVLYLHSFEYEAAAAEFREAQRLKPDFAMAYWGEAMTYNHPVWDQQDHPAALAALNRLDASREARAGKAPTERERTWLNAVEILYGEGSKIRRDTLYSVAMESIAQRWPDDLEAQTFYALSLLGLSQTTRVIPTYMRAGAIALKAMKQNPDHPGAAHYVIHAFDDPIHAPLGLPAADAYGGIAPAAAHAQHMTTHIYLALGMWDKVVSQNIIASGPDSAKWKPGHYTSWLLYGLLQQGRFQDAAALLSLMDRNLSPSDPVSRRASLLQMRDYYVINAEDWRFAPPPLNIEGAGVVFRAGHAFTLGYAAIRSGRLEDARSQARELLSMTNNGPGAVGVMADELSGLVHVMAGDTAQGLGMLRQATAIEDTLPMEFGPPLIVKPSHELLGETYLHLQRPAEARREFQRALELAPGRLRSQRGLKASCVNC